MPLITLIKKVNIYFLNNFLKLFYLNFLFVFLFLETKYVSVKSCLFPALLHVELKVKKANRKKEKKKTSRGKK